MSTCTLTLWFCLALVLAPLQVAADDSYLFDVWLDDRPIGSHSFEMTGNGDETRVVSLANYEVKVLFVKVYEYSHRADEVWRGDCLVGLASETDDNGKPFSVDMSSEMLGESCQSTFAYWDRDKISKPVLMNAQTGKEIETELLLVGEEVYADTPSVRYDLQAGELGDISIWYRKGDSRWLGIEMPGENGVVRYTPAE